ncbi:TadE/TadG family type IV pilus assembly protein [Bradyrhizobium sp. URHD0069]|uniref:TadE/TadG family type IV pilus assembly protein n=1 Tax=Bradyrhizobium sp. URHD0069 TaxID=1380355 RepID=UPI0004964DE8|nr:TadE/TadG family type IV pilus assembly protein [Bradyrhizobium sp. URHD0069]
MTTRIMRLRRFVTTFRDDTRGAILPYVTVLMVVFIGMGALALDGGRFFSLQTQMQSVADALALAGARELNQRDGAIERAKSAINTMVDNRLSALGYSGPIAHATPKFYSALPRATDGWPVTETNSDLDAKFVAVTVNPVTIPTIMPITFFQSAGVNSFSTGARAIAGFTSQTVCDIPPVFICNPYETGGMSDSEATLALRANINPQQQMRLDPTKTGPGQFGYLMPPDACNGASCLEDWIAMAKPKACYQRVGVDLNTGFKNSVTDGFNVRFDMYENNLKKYIGNPNYAPALNVRKGYQTTGAVCAPAKPNPYYTTLPSQTASMIPNSTITIVKGDTDDTNKTCNKTPSPCILTNVPANVVTQVQTWLASGKPHISGAHIPAGAVVEAASAGTLTLDRPVTGKQTGVLLTIGWPTSSLPMDTNLVGNSSTFGNSQWDCENYWKINHPGVAPPDGCSTPEGTTVSRYAIYQQETTDDYSWPGSAAAGGEKGAPICSTPGVGPSNTQTDRRLIYAAVINCLANGPFGGGQTANNVPVAGFGKFFMTQPVGADPSTPAAVIGEMSGLVGSLDNVRIMNQVQLYR